MGAVALGFGCSADPVHSRSLLVAICTYSVNLPRAAVVLFQGCRLQK